MTSTGKYADLPDIDTAPDIYETEDVFPGVHDTKSEESDDEGVVSQRGQLRTRSDVPGKEEIDSNSLIGSEEATRRFRKAERKSRSRTLYTYPSSSIEHLPEDVTSMCPLPFSQRLRTLQNELSLLETELADPSNPQLVKEREAGSVDPGELIRGLTDVRGRLEKIRKEKEGRAKLVGIVLHDSKNDDEGLQSEEQKESRDEPAKPQQGRTVAEMDRRVGELEKLIGSSSTSLDETSPLPPPLLSLITKLNAQVTLLTQPRHIDSISRRLKLLLSDLERASAAQHHAQRRHNSEPGATIAPPSQLQEQMLPLLTRLGPSLPHIPHILTRLRTLASLHMSASEFQSTLEGLEQEQQKMHDTLTELQIAVGKVEASLEDNRGIVRGNVTGLETRVDSLLSRLEDLGAPKNDTQSIFNP